MMKRPVMMAASTVAAVTALAATAWYTARRESSPASPTVAERDAGGAGRRAAADPQPRWRIAMLGSGFADDDEFRHTARVFEQQVIGKDPFFSSAAIAPRLEFVPIGTYGSITLTQPKGARCYFKWDAAFGKALGAVLRTQELAGLTSIMVLNNAKEENACTAGELIIANRTAYRAAAHEFGHLIGGLFDEDKGHTGRAKPVAGPNCASDINRLPWDHSKFADPPKPGCWFDDTLWRPGDNCKMQKLEGEFCSACQQRLEEVFTASAPTAAPTESHTQFVLQVWQNNVFDVVSHKVYPGPVPPRVMRGPIVAGAVVERDVCLGGSFVGRLSTRSYRGLEEDPEIPETASDSIFAVLNCPGNVPEDRVRTLEMFRVPINRQPWLTPELFREHRGKDDGIRIFNVR